MTSQSCPPSLVLFDLLLAHNPAMVAYVAAALMLSRREELMMMDDDVEPDLDVMYATLARVPDFHHGPSPSTSPSTTSPSSSAPPPPPPPPPPLTPPPSYLSDPDVSVPAFDHLDEKQVDQKPEPPASPPSVSVEHIIAHALALYHAHPPTTAAIDILGPNSCVFTWPDGVTDDATAERIVRNGLDIVLPPPPPPTPTRPVPPPRRPRSRKLVIRRDTLAAMLTTMVGLTAVIVAVYGNEALMGWAVTARTQWVTHISPPVWPHWPHWLTAFRSNWW